MDLTKNRIPDHVEWIHLIAVCGTGMGALAGMLKDMGYKITGSDQGVYPPMSVFLADKGIEVTEGFDAANLAGRPDLVVVGNAVVRTNPEAQAVFDLGLDFCSMPQAISHFMGNGRKTLMVTGTHGKTTTASLLAKILFEAGLDPSYFIGGIVRDFNSNFRRGNGGYFVIEGDEYDTAFFDKGPKFLHFDPHMAVMTSVEFDHADIFSDLDHVKSFFNRMIDRMRPESTLLAYDGDANITDLLQSPVCRVARYGRGETSPWRLGTVDVDAPWTDFQVLKNGELFGEFRTRMVGNHNLFNALSVIALADMLEIPSAAIRRALETFEGPKRRQEIRGVKNGITVMDDFAHHPTAVRETLRAVRPHYPNGRIIAVFEPRTNTSMRRIFQDIYPTVFEDADLICIREPSLLGKIPEAERMNARRLVDDLQNSGKKARHFADTEGIIEALSSDARPGDLILVMSNGGFDNIHERLLSVL